MFHSPPNEAPQQGVPNLIEEQPENGRVRVEVGVRVDGRQPQQIEQTRTASLTTEAELRQIVSPAHHLYCWLSLLNRKQLAHLKCCILV